MLIDLNAEEVRLIQTHRANIEEVRLRMEKRKNCTHDWKYVGHSHNDDCYDCRLCGETKFE